MATFKAKIKCINFSLNSKTTTIEFDFYDIVSFGETEKVVLDGYKPIKLG